MPNMPLLTPFEFLNKSQDFFLIKKRYENVTTLQECKIILLRNIKLDFEIPF